MKDNNLREKAYYKDKIVKMVREIESIEFLEMIYGFVNRLHKEEAGN